MDDVTENKCNETTQKGENCSSLSKEEDNVAGLEAVAVPLTFAAILIVGLIGNGLLLYHVIRRRKLRTPHNIYLVNLAVGDLVMLGVAMPFISTIYTFAAWPYGEVICKLSEFVQTLCTSTTIATIGALSLERYFIVSLRRPGKRKKIALVGVAVIWAVSCVLALPNLVSAHIRFDRYCFLFPRSWGSAYQKMYTLMNFLLLFAFPLCIISIIYTAMTFRIILDPAHLYNEAKATIALKSGDRRAGTQGSDDVYMTSMRERKRVAITVFGLVAVFTVCWLPRHVFLIWYHFDPAHVNAFWHVFKIVSFCLMFANSSLNPVVYYLLDSNFRKFVRLAVCCRKFNPTTRCTDATVTIDPQTIQMTELPNQCTASVDIL